VDGMSGRKWLLAAAVLGLGVLLYAPIPVLDVGSFVILFGGLALLLVYRTKKRALPLIAGAYLTYIGIMNITRMFATIRILDSLFGAMFFVVPGLIFLVLYIERDARWMLTPAVVLTVTGLFVFVANLFSLGLRQMLGAALIAGGIYLVYKIIFKNRG
jgi:hypothetical protein